MERVFAGQRPTVRGLYLLQANSTVDVFIRGIICAGMRTIARTSVGSAVRLSWLRLIVKIVDEPDGCERHDAHR